ncbi:MAG: UDP-N-acetylglucosamine 2-epimerase (non-hydrolyzing) [Candidatus Marinimicrobia bacterium]|nr:UDP-N-acetylglucosamine 2-epimerase (non-hydrolyzing) [Candidatus Neomarinimicrobiota bacterium]
MISLHEITYGAAQKLNRPKKYKIILVAGARPNFMKIAPLMNAMKNHPTLEAILVHTGQHYDEKMSHSFFDQLNIPKPHINLEVGSGSHATQTARIMEKFEIVCFSEKPDMVLVVGDVNSTAACSLVASKLHIKVCHYEAGLRSQDRNMPEEINRLVTDAITDLFITTSTDATDNLISEGIHPKNIHMLGNLMIDSLVSHLGLASTQKLNLRDVKGNPLDLSWRTNTTPYAMMTFHRPSNVDEGGSLSILVEEWLKTAELMPIIFPIHPRTLGKLEQFKLLDRLTSSSNIYLTGPLAYLDFLKLVSESALVITDSGGIQEETTYLKIPCLTIRPTTERPITIWAGSNQLVLPEDIFYKSKQITEILKADYEVPIYWEGQAATRIINMLETYSAGQL